MTPDMARHLAIAAAEYCHLEETRAHACLYYGNLTEESRNWIVKPYAERPWRGTMHPALVHIINILEEAGLYDAPALTIPATAVV